MCELDNLKWIAVPQNYETAIVRKYFNIQDKKRTEIYICGLGFFTLYVNGKKVSDELLNPVWSDYEKRNFADMLYPVHDTFTHRIYYRKYDISHLVCRGENVIAVELANGWYRQNQRNVEGKLSYGETLKLSYAIMQGNQIVTQTDGTELCCASEITSSNIYYGEKHNLSQKQNWFDLKFDDGNWNTVTLIDTPVAEKQLQNCPCDVVVRKIKPKLLSKQSNVYDAKENITGYAVIKATSNTVTVRYAECITDDKPDFTSCGGENQIQQDVFINCTPNTLLRPRYSIHAFQYVEVTGGTVQHIEVVHSNIKQTSYFTCNNDTVNRYYDAFVRTMLNNMHCGVPSDCPHRERLGYTGDGQLTAESAMLALDARLFYKKWIQDILDCQDIATGHVQHTAPFYGGGGGPSGWGGAIVFVPYVYYKLFGDKQILEQCFPYIIKWLNSMYSFTVDGLIAKEIDGGWCLGDWCAPEQMKVPADLVNTSLFVDALQKIDEMAQAIGANVLLDDKIAEYKTALKNKYTKNGKCLLHGQGAELFLIDLELVDETEMQNVNDYYKQLATFDTGIFATPLLVKLLCKTGYLQTAFDLLTSQKSGSFGMLQRFGTNTLWECFNDCYYKVTSHNHHMFGASVKYLYEFFAGIQQDADSIGYDKVTITPPNIDGLYPLTCKLVIGDKSIFVKYKKTKCGLLAKIKLRNVSARLVYNGKTYVLTHKSNNILLQ